MRRISEWFDRHMKTRIALQLVLDGLPILVMIAHLLSGYTVRMYTNGWSGEYHFERGILFDLTLIAFLIIPIPVYVASFIWHDKVFDLFERFPWCRRLSTTLRITSALPVSFSLLIDILLLALWSMTW